MSLDFLGLSQVLVVRDVHSYEVLFLSLKNLLLVFVMVVKLLNLILVQDELALTLVDLPDVVHVLQLQPHIFNLILDLNILLLISSNLRVVILPLLCLNVLLLQPFLPLIRHPRQLKFHLLKDDLQLCHKHLIILHQLYDLWIVLNIHYLAIACQLCVV